VNNDIVEMIAVAVAAAMAEARREKEMWTAEDIGFHMGIGARRVLEHYACKPDFPAASRAEPKGGGRGHPLWFPEEVRKWWRKNQSKN
jgi:hypothetical protein